VLGGSSRLASALNILENWRKPLENWKNTKKCWKNGEYFRNLEKRYCYISLDMLNKGNQT
jgi:hypothetical protein